MNNINNTNELNNRQIQHLHPNYHLKLQNLTSIQFYNLQPSSSSDSTLPISSNNQSTSNPPHKQFKRRTSVFSEYDLNHESISTITLHSFFVSIHLHKSDKLLYVSEVSNLEINPRFEISLPYIPPSVTKVVIKLWYNKQDNNRNLWEIYCMYKLNLSSNFIVIDDSLVNKFQIFKQNSLSLRLGIHNWFTITDMLVKKSSNEIKYSRHRDESLKSYSFDIIRSINNLYKSTKELELSKNKLGKQINKLYKVDNLENLGNLTKLIDKLNYDKRLQLSSLDNIEKKNQFLMNKIDGLIMEKEKIHNFISSYYEEEYQVHYRLKEIDDEQNSINQSMISNNLRYRRQLSDHFQIINQAFTINEVSTNSFSIVGLEFPTSIKELLNLVYHSNTTDNTPQLLKNRYYQPTFTNETQLKQFQLLQINTILLIIGRFLNLVSNLTTLDLQYKMINNNDHLFIIDESSEKNPLVNSGSNQIRNQRQYQLMMKRPFKFPLFYDPLLNQQVVNKNGETFVMNQEFEQGLKMLNLNINNLIKQIRSKIYHDDKLDWLPNECFDNILWNLKYLQLFITA